jgi:hypothetical protein
MKLQIRTAIRTAPQDVLMAITQMQMHLDHNPKHCSIAATRRY